MEDTEKERQPMKPAKVPFDESKLTPPQRKALEIAKAQGVPFSRRIEDFDLGLTPEEGEAFHNFIMEERQRARSMPSKNYFPDED